MPVPMAVPNYMSPPAFSKAPNKRRFAYLSALSLVFLSVSYFYSGAGDKGECFLRNAPCFSAPPEPIASLAPEVTRTAPPLDKETLDGNDTSSDANSPSEPNVVDGSTVPNTVDSGDSDTVDSEEPAAPSSPSSSSFDEIVGSTIAAAASLLRSTQTRLRPLPLPTLYEYRLLPSELADKMHREAFVSKPASVMTVRLKRALARGFLRIPLRVAALGGSVTYGVGTDLSWANRVFQWIEDVLPKPLVRDPPQEPNGKNNNVGAGGWVEGTHDYMNGAIRASGAQLPSLCFPEYIGTELDIVLLDFHINGATIDQMHLLLSRLLNLPRLPAVVEVAVFRTRGNGNAMFPRKDGPVETDFIRVGKAVGLPIFDIWEGVKNIWKDNIPNANADDEVSEEVQKQNSKAQGRGLTRRAPANPENWRKLKKEAQAAEHQKQMAAERSYEGFFQLFYRDKIHFNNVGHNITASIVIDYFKSLILELTEADLKDAWTMNLGNPETRDQTPAGNSPPFATQLSEKIYSKERQREISSAPQPAFSTESTISHSLYAPPPPSSPARWPIQCFSRYGPVKTEANFAPSSVSRSTKQGEWGDWRLNKISPGKIWWTGRLPGSWASWTVPLSKVDVPLRGGEVGVGFNKGYKGGVGVALLEVKDEKGRMWVEAFIDTKWSTLQHVFHLWWSGCLLPPDVQHLVLTFTIPPYSLVPGHDGRLVELLGVYWRGHSIAEKDGADVAEDEKTVPMCKQRHGLGIQTWIQKHKLGVHNGAGGATPGGAYVDMTGHIDDDGTVLSKYSFAGRKR